MIAQKISAIGNPKNKPFTHIDYISFYLSSLLLIDMKTAMTIAAKTAKNMKMSSSITTILSAFDKADLNLIKRPAISRKQLLNEKRAAIKTALL